MIIGIHTDTNDTDVVGRVVLEALGGENVTVVTTNGTFNLTVSDSVVPYRRDEYAIEGTDYSAFEFITPDGETTYIPIASIVGVHYYQD